MTVVKYHQSINGWLVSLSKVILTIDNYKWGTDIDLEMIIGSNILQVSIGIMSRQWDINSYKKFGIQLKLKNSDKSHPWVCAKPFILSEQIGDQQANRNLETEIYKLVLPQIYPGVMSDVCHLAIPKEQLIANNNTLSVGIYLFVTKQNLNCIENIYDYRKSFNVKETNDFVIICGEKQFFVSKAILTSRSEVFKTMFLNDMSEQNKNQLIIEDIEEEVMEAFLKYLYFGFSVKLDELREELLYVSEKYQVLDLKKICENFIFVEINAKNAIKLLITFDKFNCNEMRGKTIEFIASNSTKVKEEYIANHSNEEWLKFVGINKHIFDQIGAEECLVRGRVQTDDPYKQYTFHFIQ